MAGKTILYEWPERWEEALNGPGSADLDAFVRQYCQEGDPSLVAEFRRRADVLRSINADLRAFGAAHDTGPDSPGSTDARSGARSALQPGQEAAPGYRLERFLGRGGFGEVWQARALSGGSVALKFVRLGDQIAQIELRSLDLMSQVRHPHLLSVLGSWKLDGFLIVAMELADQTLNDRLQKVKAEGRPGIPRDELLRFFEQAADALDYLNRSHQGPDGQTQPAIQHRDIKPQNLLMVGDTLKIGDFGLARCLENSVTSHTGCHTPAYAAPEFFDGKATNQSDQYSPAVTWCVLRGGRLPFAGTGAQIMSGHLLDDPDLSMLPEEEKYPALRALSKQPKKRWPSCRSFVEALRSGFDVHAVRQALLANPMDEPLRRLYLALRTPELKDRDRRGIRVRPLVIYCSIALAIVVVAASLIAWFEPPKDPTSTWEPVLKIVTFVLMLPALPAIVWSGVRKDYRSAVSFIDKYGPRQGSIYVPRGGLLLSIYWRDPGEADSASRAEKSG